MKTKLIVFLLVLVQFAQFGMFLPAVKAKETKECMAETAVIFKIHLQITTDGYFDENSVNIKSIDVPANTCIEAFFVYGGDLEGDESNIHAFIAVPKSENDLNEYESEEQIGPTKFDHTHKTTSLFFPSGKKGPGNNSIACVIGDCEGMEHLFDLIVNSV